TMKSLLFTGVSRAGTAASLSGDLRGADRRDERGDDRLDARVVRDGLGAENDSVPQHAVRERLDVLRHDVVAAGQDRAGTGRLGEGDTPARAGAELDVPRQRGRDVRL